MSVRPPRPVTGESVAATIHKEPNTAIRLQPARVVKCAFLKPIPAVGSSVVVVPPGSNAADPRAQAVGSARQQARASGSNATRALDVYRAAATETVSQSQQCPLLCAFDGGTSRAGLAEKNPVG